jgi:phenylacetate-CoA ligase
LGFEVKTALAENKRIILDLVADFDSKARLEASELERVLAPTLKSLILAAHKSSFWNARLKDNISTVLEKDLVTEILDTFPVLTRSEVQEFGDWMRVWIPNSKPSQYQKSTTSGSTGKPVTIHKHAPSQVARHAAVELLDASWQRRDLTKNMAFLKIDSHNDHFESMGEPFTYVGATGKMYRRSILSNTVAELLDFLVEEEIDNFLANAMVLNFLVREQVTNPRPGARFSQILNWADKIEPSLREQVREAFGAKICDRYSTSEFGFLAIQCPEAEHLHALQFNNYIEILDENDKRCEVGQLGRVVVTSLVNTTMPLIRYEVGDIAAWGESCTHGIGLPVFKPDIVRHREAIILENGQLEIPYMDGTKFSKHPALVNSQIYRFEDGIVILFEALETLPEDFLAESEIELGEVFRTSQQVTFWQVESLEWLGMWKRKLVIPVAQNRPEGLDLSYFQGLGASAALNSGS